MYNCETSKILGLIGVNHWCHKTWCQMIALELMKLQETIKEVEALEVE